MGESQGSWDTQGGRQEGRRNRAAEDSYMQRKRAREERHRQQAEERGRLKENTPPREWREELEHRMHREGAWVGIHSLRSFPPITRPGNGRRGALQAPRTRAR